MEYASSVLELMTCSEGRGGVVLVHRRLRDARARNAAMRDDDDCDNEDSLLYADEGRRKEGKVLEREPRCSKADTLTCLGTLDFLVSGGFRGF